MFCHSESEEKLWYYSSIEQFEEVLSSLDREHWEADLYGALIDFREDILRQMSITEELTDHHKGSRKSILEIENSKYLVDVLYLWLAI